MHVHLVPADEGQLRLEWPVSLARVQVGMAHTGTLDLDEALAGCELRGLTDGMVVDDLQGRVGRLDDRGLLGLGNLELR